MWPSPLLTSHQQKEAKKLLATASPTVQTKMTQKQISNSNKDNYYTIQYSRSCIENGCVGMAADFVRDFACDDGCQTSQVLQTQQRLQAGSLCTRFIVILWFLLMPITPKHFFSHVCLFSHFWQDYKWMSVLPLILLLTHLERVGVRLLQETLMLTLMFVDI